MNTKLTLNVDKDVIKQAKIYAKEHQISLSQLIENFLQSLQTKNQNQSKISPLVESLTGVISSTDLDDKKNYYDYLNPKYSIKK
jgi:hypothetical protein